MPSVEENRRHWTEYDWSRAGEEWSEPWGGTEFLWRDVVLPRIVGFVPTSTILEIGPGHARMSRHLRSLCEQLILVDVAASCLEACQRVFRVRSGVVYRLTTGKALPGVSDGSVDFVFSYDALVHAEIDVVAGYVGEVARVLTPEGACILHHSNLLEAGPKARFRNPGWRGETVSASLVKEITEAAGLICLRQEVVEWGDGELTDCFTTIVRPGPARSPQPRIERRRFMPRQSGRNS